MSEDQVNKTDKTVITEESYEDIPLMDGTLDDVSIFVGSETPDDTGKTPEQILAECKVTQEELDKTFPADYKPLQDHPGKLSREELMQRVRDSYERQKNLRAQNDEKVEMPSMQDVNQKFMENAPESIGIGVADGGPRFSFDTFLALLEKSKQDAARSKASEEIKRAKQAAADEFKKSLEDIIETSEMETFNAETARKIYLDKIKVHSRLPDILKHIRRCASKGNYEVQVDYLGRYDSIKLAELGFTVVNNSGGGRLSYMVSWHNGARP